MTGVITGCVLCTIKIGMRVLILAILAWRVVATCHNATNATDMHEDECHENWPTWAIVLAFALSFCLPCIAALGFFFFYFATNKEPVPGLPMQPASIRRAGFAVVPSVELEMPPMFITPPAP